MTPVATALPPVAALTIAIAVLGVLDATAGFVAILTFTIGVLALGGIDSNAQLRLMLGLGALWFVVPVLAGAVRPLRREPTRNLVESWERAADFVIASLIGAWAVQKIVLALPGLAGAQLPISAHADLAALCVLAALVGRLVFETIAAHLYPRRLDVSEAGRAAGARSVAAPRVDRTADGDLRVLRAHRRRRQLAAVGGGCAVRRAADPRRLRGALSELARPCIGRCPRASSSSFSCSSSEPRSARC